MTRHTRLRNVTDAEQADAAARMIDGQEKAALALRVDRLEKDVNLLAETVKDEQALRIILARTIEKLL